MFDNILSIQYCFYICKKLWWFGINIDFNSHFGIVAIIGERSFLEFAKMKIIYWSREIIFQISQAMEEKILLKLSIVIDDVIFCFFS